MEEIIRWFSLENNPWSVVFLEVCLVGPSRMAAKQQCLGPEDAGAYQIDLVMEPWIRLLTVVMEETR